MRCEVRKGRFFCAPMEPRYRRGRMRVGVGSDWMNVCMYCSLRRRSAASTCSEGGVGEGEEEEEEEGDGEGEGEERGGGRRGWWEWLREDEEEWEEEGGMGDGLEVDGCRVGGVEEEEELEEWRR